MRGAAREVPERLVDARSTGLRGLFGARSLPAVSLEIDNDVDNAVEEMMPLEEPAFAGAEGGEDLQAAEPALGAGEDEEEDDEEGEEEDGGEEGEEEEPAEEDEEEEQHQRDELVDGEGMQDSLPALTRAPKPVKVVAPPAPTQIVAKCEICNDPSTKVEFFKMKKVAFAYVMFF